MFSAMVPSNRKLSCMTTPRYERKSRRRKVCKSLPSTLILPESGWLKFIARLISVLLPEPLEPTSAVVEPAGALKETFFSTGVPSLYSNQTFSNAIESREGFGDLSPDGRKLDQRHGHHSREEDVHEQIANRHFPADNRRPA